MLTEASKREIILHCHISEQNKKWLIIMSDKLNRPMGSLVDDIISQVRKETREREKK